MDYKLLSVPIFLIGGCIYLYCFLKTIGKYREKKGKSAVPLLILFLSCVVINFASAMDGAFWQVAYSFHIGYAISMPFTALGISSLLFFATDIFSNYRETEKKVLRNRRIFFVVYIMILSIWAILSLFPDPLVPSTIPLTFIFLTSLTVYIIIAKQSYNLAKKVDDTFYKKYILYIGHYALGNILIYVFYIIDGAVPADDGTTIWSFIGVCVFAFTSYLAYKGFIAPMKSKK